ncbi:MAG TPA: HAMP domain-containing sensor histidine kinase [Chloroflexota bacterium]|nr:HAMP domain-containing sensor histidine kinase [Chloroflexota bacterium]
MIGLALLVCCAAAADWWARGQPVAGDLPTVLTVTFLLALYTGLTLHPVPLARDRKVSAASAPAFSLALLLPPVLAAALIGLCAAAAQWRLGRRHYVVAFNVAQWSLAAATTGVVASWVRASRAPAGTDLLAAAAAYFLVNTGAVSAMIGARRGVPWHEAWRATLRSEGPVEAALLSAGALLVALDRAAPLTLVLLIPPLLAAWRVADYTARLHRLNAELAAQRRFVADAAHELRTPAAALRAQIDALEIGRQGRSFTEQLEQLSGKGAYRPADGDVAETLAGMRRAVSRLTDMLANLLTIARADEGDPAAREPVDAEELLVQVYREMAPLVEGVRLVLDVEDGADGVPPTILGDHERLHQLVVNLVANAQRHTPLGGEVRLGLRTEHGGVVLTVMDTGCGIAAEDLPHIFERFFRRDPPEKLVHPVAARSHGGSGLGLAIARAVVEEHGGHISVQSALNCGSTFTVRLPLARDHTLPVSRCGVQRSTPEGAARRDQERVIRPAA